MPLFFYSLPNGRGGAFCIYRWGSVCWEVGIGATERALEGFLRGFEWFLLCLWGFLEVFLKIFATHKTRWLGSLVSGRVFGTLSRPCLCPTSPYFGLQTHFGICIVVWVAAARRKKRRASSVFLLVGSGWTTFNCIVFWFLAWRNFGLPVGDVGRV